MRADSTIINWLPDNLIKDWYEHRIFSEYDLQVCAYHWLRQYFDKLRAAKWVVRTQPLLVTNGILFRPDIVIYRGGVPYDVIELKFQMSGFSEVPIVKDYNKLQALKEHWNIRHAYELMMYDDDRNWSLKKVEWMKNYLTFIGINIRRLKNNRLRTGYRQTVESWRRKK